MMKRLLIFVFLLPLPLLADTIYTWGYGETFYEIFLGLAAFANDGYLIKIAGGLGMITLVFKMLDGRSAPIMEVGKFFLMTAFVYFAFMTAGTGGVYRHVIQDQVNGYTNVVDGVPIGVGKALGIVTGLEYAIAQGMEHVFSTPSSTQYSNSGLGFPLVAHSNMAKMHSVDPFVQKTLDDYIGNCLMYDMMDGTIDPNAIFNSGDILADISSTSTRMTNIYSQASPGGSLQTCSQAYPLITTQISTMMNNIKMVIAAQSGMTTGGSTTAFDNKASDVAQLYFGISKSSTAYMTQAVTMNMMSDGLTNVAKISGIDPAALAYGTSMAERSAQSNFTVQGELAKKYLPLLKGILTMLIVGIGWILAFMAVIFFDPQYLRMYLSLLIFLSLWTPLSVMLNFITDIYLQKTLTPLGQVGNWYTMANKSMVDSEVMSTLAWLGYLGWSIPMLAYSIAKKSDHGFVSLTSGLTGAMGSGASTAAGEMARGNIQMGRASIGKKESYADGSSYHEDQRGQVSNQAINEGGRTFDTSHKNNEGTIVSEQTSTASGTSVASVGGVVAQADFKNINTQTSANYQKTLGKDISRLSAEEVAAQEVLQKVGESAITQAHSTKGSHSTGASTKMSASDKATLDHTMAKALDKASTEGDGTFSKEASGFGYGVGGNGSSSLPGAGGAGKWAAMAKSMKVGADGRWSYQDDKGHEHKFSEETSAKISDSFKKSISEDVVNSKEFGETFSRLAESNKTAMEGTKYSNGESLVTAYKSTVAEKESLQNTQSEGLNLTQDRKIAMMNEAAKESMIEERMKENGGNRQEAERSTQEQLDKQGKGVFTEQQLRQGINYIDKAVLDANNGDGEKLANIMQNATRHDNPNANVAMPKEEGFVPISGKVHDELKKAETDQSRFKKEGEAVKVEADKDVNVNAPIAGITSQVKAKGAHIRGAAVGTPAGFNGQMQKVQEGKQQDMDDLQVRKGTAIAMAAASAFNNLFQDGKGEKAPTRGEKLQKEVDETAAKRDSAKADYDNANKLDGETQAKKRMNDIISQKQEGMTDKGSAEYQKLEHLKEDIKSGHVNENDLVRNGLSPKDFKENGIRFDKNGNVDMQSSGERVKYENIKESQAKFAEADVAHNVAKDTNELFKANPNIAPQEAKEGIRDIAKKYASGATEVLGDTVRAVGKVPVIGGLIDGGIAVYTYDSNLPAKENVRNIAQAIDPTLGGVKATEDAWNNSKGDKNEFLRSVPQQYAKEFTQIFENLPSFGAPKTSVEMHKDDIKVESKLGPKK